jgi:3-oxoacyl-[acyl-carrier protein] reductase
VNNIEVIRNADVAAANAGKQCVDAMSFFLTPDSAFISGQTVRMEVTSTYVGDTGYAGLRGKTALVTGAARGIGASIAHRLAAEGARIIALDNWKPSDTPSSTDIEQLYGSGSIALAVDVAASSAGAQILSTIHEYCGAQVDIVVHNAGITRDKTLKNMAPEAFQKVVEVNFQAIQRINEFLGLGSARPLAVRERGRVIALSSINGIAGAAGQTNYAFTKGALMGYVVYTARMSSHLALARCSSLQVCGAVESACLTDSCSDNSQCSCTWFHRNGYGFLDAIYDPQHWPPQQRSNAGRTSGRHRLAYSISELR